MAECVVLRGCTAEPMGAYLKALGVFRVVSEQADPAARGWWDAGRFVLGSAFSEGGLSEFLLERYRPTPIVAPWNGGSGFYEGDRTDGLEAILECTAQRFREYQGAIRSIQAWPEMPEPDVPVGEMLTLVEQVSEQVKEGKRKRDLLRLLGDARRAVRVVEASPDAPIPLTIGRLEGYRSRRDRAASGQVAEALKTLRKLRTAAKKLRRAAGKEDLVRACRNRLPDSAVDWVDAAVVLTSDNRLDFPPVLGRGGNEGHLDYSNSFMCRLADVLISGNRTDSAGLLRNALFGEPVGGFLIAATGQHDPGRAGGFNQGPEVETKDFPINPWNFVLTMEGAVAWASGVGRRQATGARKRACSPFTVSLRAVGYGSSAETEHSSPLAEIWMPLWERPARFEEVRLLLREGRAEIGRRPAADGLEFAQAAASLGVDRGLTEFVRYGLLKRRGDSYVALPASRFKVRECPESDLIQDVDALLGQLRRCEARLRRDAQQAPARFSSARRGIENSLYEFLLRGESRSLKGLLAALGRVEQYIAARDSREYLPRPLSGLRPAWLAAADDGSAEFRVAAALASIASTGHVGPLRANLSSIDPQSTGAWAEGNGQKAWAGNTLPARLAGLLRRRMMDAERLLALRNPVYGLLPLDAADVCGLLGGGLDEPMIEDLMFGASLIDWQDQTAASEVRDVLLKRWAGPVCREGVSRAYALLKHLFLPGPLRLEGGVEVSIRAEPSVIPLLCAGRVSEACRVAQRRLYAAGLSPSSVEFQGQEDGQRLAACLLLPVRNIHQLMKLVLASQPSKS